MNHISRALGFLVVLFLIHAPVGAQTPAWNENVLSITPHTACADGSPATNCPVAQWRIERAATPTATTWDFVAFIPVSQLRYVHTGVTAGQHCYRAKAITADGFATTASAVTANSCKTNVAPDAPNPNPPGPVIVATTTAYEIRKNSQGVYVATRMGIVPAGTICGAETRTTTSGTYRGTFNRIDPKSVDLVNWPAKIPPEDIFASCG